MKSTDAVRQYEPRRGCGVCWCVPSMCTLSLIPVCGLQFSQLLQMVLTGSLCAGFGWRWICVSVMLLCGD
jgi:hypothetical protein